MTQRQTVLTGRSPRALMSTRSLKIGTSQFRTLCRPLLPGPRWPELNAVMAALTTQAPITNEEAASSTTDLSVNADGVKISATGAAESGINQLHRGEGDITVNVSNSCVETTGAGGSVHEASGILASSKSDTDPKTNVGDVKIDVRDSTITTQGRRAKGIVGAHTHTGDVDIDVENTAITTEGEYAYGVHGSRNGTGDVTIGVENSTLTVKGERSRGIYGFHSGTGDVNLNVNNTTINVLGRLGYGVYGQQHRLGTGSVNIMLNNVDLMSKNVSVFGYTDGLGDTIIDVQNSAITAESIAIYGYHVGGGGDSEVGLIDIDVRDTIITTTTDDDKAIYAYHGVPPVVGDTEVDIENTIITTFGADADGIFGRHTSGMGAFDINVLNGSVIHAIGDGSSGVRVGSLNNNGEVIDAGGIGDDGYRLHNILIDGQVTGNLAGVYLAGGGRVVIGPKGSVGAKSGIAILATGVTPKLRVDMNLAGRRVAQAIGDNWIINDGGETTIAVNRTVLHDGVDGVTGRTAANGAWNVRMREEGVNVTDYTTDPANWVVSELATGVVADRDFSAQDFNERRKPPPPPSPPPPPMRQPVMVDERVFGGPDDPAGVLLEGDGEVYIGPEGSVGAESGIAILAMGDSRELLVDMNLNGRRVAEVIGDDWIIKRRWRDHHRGQRRDVAQGRHGGCPRRGGTQRGMERPDASGERHRDGLHHGPGELDRERAGHGSHRRSGLLGGGLHRRNARAARIAHVHGGIRPAGGRLRSPAGFPAASDGPGAEPDLWLRPRRARLGPVRGRAGAPMKPTAPPRVPPMTWNASRPKVA